jgi:hypothetical protein
VNLAPDAELLADAAEPLGAGLRLGRRQGQERDHAYRDACASPDPTGKTLGGRLLIGNGEPSEAGAVGRVVDPAGSGDPALHAIRINPSAPTKS